MENLCLLPEAKPGAGDLGLHRMTSTIYGIAMLVAAIGIPGAMIKYVTEFKDDRTRFSLIKSYLLALSLPYFLVSVFNMPGLSGLLEIITCFSLCFFNNRQHSSYQQERKRRRLG